MSRLFGFILRYNQPRPISAAIKSIIPEWLKADKWDNLLWQKTRTGVFQQDAGAKMSLIR